MFLFSLFKRKGCLTNKTKRQKEDFFKQLLSFEKADGEFFAQQYIDLQTWEKKRFKKWIKKNIDYNNITLSLLKVFDSVMIANQREKAAMPGYS